MHAQQLSHTQRPQQALCLLTARKKKKNEQQEKQANPWAKRRDESKENGMTCNRNQLLQQNAKSSPDKDRECLFLSKDQHAKSEPMGLIRQRFSAPPILPPLPKLSQQRRHSPLLSYLPIYNCTEPGSYF